MTVYNVPTRQFLGDAYYKISLEGDTNVKYQENAPLILKCVDIYGDPVEGKEFTLTTDKGLFEVGGTKTITARTDEDGEILATVDCNEWGFYTVQCENIERHIMIDDWRLILEESAHNLFLYRNNEFAQLVLKGAVINNVITNSWTNFGEAMYAQTVKPFENEIGISSAQTQFRVDPSTGGIQYRTIGYQTNNIPAGTTHHLSMLWRIKE